ncbi:MAG: carbohydrate ABC transporter substrate-binding protein [Lachnospiraceae bacterium]|nr:carbohydrate ABC transporter substrate-binding protein [Lachnospiraceae bacterium]
MMKWGKCIFLLGMLFVLSLSGCAKQPEQVKGIEDTVVKTEVDWEQGFTVGEVKEGQEWNTCDFQRINQTRTGEGDYKGGKALTNSLHEFVEIAYYVENGEMNYYIKRISPEGQELSETVIDKSSWGTEESQIFAYDVVGEKMYFGVSEQGSVKSAFALPEHVYIMTVDKDGKLLAKVDLRAGLASLGCNESPAFFYVDGEGYIYVQTQDTEQRGAMYVMDSAGNGVLSYLCDMPYKDIFFTPVRDNHGRQFIPLYEYSDKATILLWMDSNHQWKELARLEGKTISTWFGMDENLVFYQNGDKLVRWDVTSGNAEALLSLKSNGFDGWQTLLAWNEEGQFYLRSRSTDKDWVVRLTSEPLPYTEPLVFGLDKEMGVTALVESAVVTYSREQAVPIEIQGDSDTNGVSRLQMEMVNGKGPDIMYVFYEDMVNLQRGGALLDLSDMLPASVTDTFLPQAVELGTLGDGFYGIPVSLELQTMFVDKEVWNESGWTMDEVLELAEGMPELEYIFTEQWLSYWVFEFFIYDITQRKSKYIDWENGESRFEELDFMAFLEKMKTYYEKEGDQCEYQQETGMDKIAAHKALGFVDGRCNPFAFNNHMVKYGDIVVPVGYPAEDRQGHYLEARKLLVVNANISEEKKEKVRDFLQYMVGEEVQKNISYEAISIIDGLFFRDITYDESMECYCYVGRNGYRGILDAREDGTNYLEEYRELLKKATPLTGNQDLLNIIAEEIQPFFIGDRSALDVTRKIDNRVQLYLDEQGVPR